MVVCACSVAHSVTPSTCVVLILFSRCTYVYLARAHEIQIGAAPSRGLGERMAYSEIAEMSRILTPEPMSIWWIKGIRIILARGIIDIIHIHSNRSEANQPCGMCRQDVLYGLSGPWCYQP
jgi:hypothetical protein